MSNIYFYYGSPGFGKTSKIINVYNAIKKHNREVVVFDGNISSRKNKSPHFLENRTGKQIIANGCIEDITLDNLESKFSSAKYILIDEVQNCTTDTLSVLLSFAKENHKQLITAGAMYGPQGEIIPQSVWLSLQQDVVSIPLIAKCTNLQCCNGDNAITSCYINTKNKRIYTKEISAEVYDNKDVKLEFFCKKCLICVQKKQKRRQNLSI